MHWMKLQWATLAVCALMIAPFAHAAPKKHVLVISLDGMRPDYVTEADKHGEKVPNLRRFLKEGTYAEGVNGVIPTLTYPSHTTIMTGVWPVQHGIYGNMKFDPDNKLNGAAITDYSTIKVETLWGAAKKAGYTVGSVGWPVTSNSKGRDFNWVAPANAQIEGTADGEKADNVPVSQIVYPANLLDTLDAGLIKKPGTTPDEYRMHRTLAMIAKFKPEFMSTHLIDLDHAQHAHGPFSSEALEAIEKLDSEVGELVAAEKKVYPDAIVIIVSDHGFLPVDHNVSLPTLFQKAGLLTTPWKVAFYPTGGVVAVILRDPKDTALRDKVGTVLKEAASHKEYGIRKVLNHDEIVAQGGNPDASFIVGFEAGYAFSKKIRDKVVEDTKRTGTHGYLPDRPEIRASFLLMGPGIAAGRDLGVIDMRQEAPTMAQVLGVKLPAAKLQPVNYKK